MAEKSKLKKKMQALSSPYKLTDAYLKYGELKHDKPSPSTFWRAEVRYVQKYQYAKI